MLQWLIDKWADMRFNYERRFMFPDHWGAAQWRDPTNGRIDRDVQWRVVDLYPVVGDSRLRSGLEEQLQKRKDLDGHDR